MMQRCRQPLLLLGLTAALVLNILGKVAEAAGEDALDVKNLTSKGLQVIPHNDNSSKVTKLLVQGNQITLNETDQQALASYPTLAELHLDGNLVTAVPAKYFSVVPHLRVLSLSRNSIQCLDPEAFFGLDVLTELDLSNNQLTSLPTQLLRGINKLQKLNLQGNPWTCSCPLLSIIGEITAANITIGPPGVTCASPDIQAGKDLLEAAAVCYPSPLLANNADPQKPTTPATSQQSRASTTTPKTTLSSSQNHSLNNDQTPVLGNTWKFTACVVALALTTSMLILCAIKGPSWYKLFHNYRHRRLDPQEDDDDNFASTVFSEIGRYHNQHTFTFETQNGRGHQEEDEDGYFEDPYIKREE
ncbi:leucine-rich repeat-containing protein 19-like isoform X1 [Hippoglossus hippoglossus]|uniref:leucine-rich repeat-containing protein 19-like isoform X1 n=1 Tax=Hippoglossus hippoglossus TaxID=8267 RepID=UPI00148E8CB4|nr:leucine-rich repeat-containing protein 19-like isoform X1 [Hippoglossus hippoglossus]XP_034428200.1 leucine-rich repeat-containing protein 19-like isoform X1 [Hippoglossus hippoglossus]